MLWLLVLLATLALSSAEREAERHQVVVVGAGISGFTAAATLLEHNVSDLVILEASDRIGGRIHTIQFAGVTIDKGAEFVHGEVDNAVYELINPYNLLTSYKPLIAPEHFVFVNTSGHFFNSTNVQGLLDEAAAILEETDVQHFNGSLAEYFHPRMDELLSSKHVDPDLGESIRRLAELKEGVLSASNGLDELGAWGLSQYITNEGDQIIKWKTGGYKTLFDYVSKKLPNPSEELPVVNKTLLNKEVTKVERRENDVEVTCADGSIYLADHVIVTVSLGVLKKHAASMFHPALPSGKTVAIETIGFGCIAKVFMLFPTRWWPTNTNAFCPLFSQKELKDFRATSEHGWWTSNTTGMLQVMNHDRMLLVWFTGDTSRALDKLSEQQVTDGLMELLNKLLGTKFDIPRPEAILRTEWGSYPYTLGTYSYRSVDSDRINATFTDLAEPILDGDKPVIQFAGEATHPDYSASVHGALATGRREAHNLLNYLNTKQ